MEKITFINSQGLSVELGEESPFILTKIEGTGAVKTNIHTHMSPCQDGVTYTSNNLEPRSLSIEIMVLGENEVDIANKRQKLLKIFNPKLEQGRLIYEFGNITREIKAISEIAPAFPENNRNFKDTMQPGLIQLYCPDPFWKDLEEDSTDLVTWIPNLEFPFSTEQTPNYWIETGEPFEEFQSGFGTGEGIEFGYRLLNQIVEIDNIGDVDTPLRVLFRASADVVKPFIQNMETYELLRINKILKAGDTLEIITEYGNKNIYLNGEKAHQYLDFLNSTWLQLKPGINLIKYGAESGINTLECRVFYTPKYLGV
ncbi:phage tail family protein [Clostridium sp. D2Q-14]|uniref:phage tail family protein n=1 Tax=Anaeromonas gelatinilytica TaxID=2683194 RepID=UPI00193BB15F|nr:phage tail family protein [Anaeromonas gelatinilytica]MBS4536803.1 phage tail family protein [Anaeromonas gelatinilytica]